MDCHITTAPSPMPSSPPRPLLADNEHWNPVEKLRAFVCKFIVEYIVVFVYIFIRSKLMTIDTNTMVSISEANKSFSNVARIVDQYGTAVILKNNTPKYVVYEFSSADSIEEASDEELLAVSSKLMKKNAKVYKELAK